LLAALAAPMPSWAARIPLPPDVSASEVDGPVEIAFGPQPTKMEMFATKLSTDGLRAFYLKELERQGWRVEPLPWEKQVKENQARFSEEVMKHPERAADPAVGRQLQAAQQYMGSFQDYMKTMVYALKGTDRLLLRFMDEDKHTVVAIHRWEVLTGGPDAFMTGYGDAPAAAASVAEALKSSGGDPTGMPALQSCCQDPGSEAAGVPPSLRQMPYSIPAYPNGRALMVAGLPGVAGTDSNMEMYATHDSPESIKQFYTAQLPASGWTLTDTTSVPMPQGPAGPYAVFAQSIKTSAMTFKTAGATCMVTIADMSDVPTGEELAAHMPPDLIQTLPPEASDMLKGEKTMAAVIYMPEPAPAPFVRKPVRPLNAAAPKKE
jgi:hypothetical protein